MSDTMSVSEARAALPRIIERVQAGEEVTLTRTAVNAGADRFVTNNSRDFPKSIAEIDICYPADLEG